MSLLQRLLGTGPDPREKMRPLWHRIIEVSREEHWYAEEGVADSVSGRFDMVTVVLALVLLRFDGEPDTAGPSALLTELFVEDMDGQLRQTGVGDLMVGKHIGKLVSVLGGRIGALRKAADDDAELQAALARNVSLLDGAGPERLAPAVRRLQQRLASTPVADMLAGTIA